MSTHPTDTPDTDPYDQEPTPETLEDLAAGEPQDDEILELYAQVQKVTEERDQTRDALMRTMAEFQNFRKRTQTETAQLRQLAAERFVTGLLPVLDNFERTVALGEGGASREALVEGVRAVERQLRSVLESQGVTRVVSVGQPFDPDLHEAVGTVVTEEGPEDVVASEVEPGYRMGDRVIRPARVRVAKRP